MWTIASVADLKDFLNGNTGRRVTGILFYRPDTPTGTAIFKSRNYWHVRTGWHLDLLCVGYASIDHSDLPGIEHKSFRQLGRGGPLYSDVVFNEIRAWAEAQFDWRYSGDADLLLIETHRANRGENTTLNSYVALPLAGLAPSFAVNGVLEEICRDAEEGSSDLIDRLSDGGAIRALIGEVARRFPGINQALDFRVRHIHKVLSN